jgi:hypothetical protein
MALLEMRVAEMLAPPLENGDSHALVSHPVLKAVP